MEQPFLHVETEGVSLNAAVESALKQLSCTRADVDIEVLQRPSSCLFGFFGKRPARVYVRICDRGIVARQVVSRLLLLSGLNAEAELLPTTNQIDLNLISDESSLLIGRYGQTLDALQTLTSTLVDRQTTERTPILIDVDGFHKRRQAFLQRLAARLTHKVRISGKPASTPPLVLSERRVLHALFNLEHDLETCSKRRDGRRKIIVVQPRG